MKVNLGSNNMSKSHFEISLDSSTTLNFGEVVSTFCKEVVADTHVNFDIRSAVRFAPLSLPTFGKAYLHKYSFYHKFKDLWSPYDCFLSQTPFTSFNGTSYIPSQCPCFPLSLLWYLVLCHSSFSTFKVVNSNAVNVGNSPISVGSFKVSPVTIGGVINFTRGMLYTLAVATHFPSGIASPSSYFLNSGRLSDLVTPLGVPTLSYLSGDDYISPSGADFFLLVKGSNLYTSSGSSFSALSTSDTSYLITFKLNNSGKLLRKIFLGLGYQIKNVTKLVSAFPLLAYYKSYFNLFAPKRFVKYEQTSFGKLLNVIEQSGMPISDVLLTDYDSEVSLLSDFIDDLLSCYYTQDTDYYSSQIIGQVNDYGGDLGQSYLSVDGEGKSSVGVLRSEVSEGVPPSINFNPSLDGTPSVQHTQAQQNLLSRLTRFVNVRSVLGGKISDLLQSIFGISKTESFDDSDPYIGSSVVEVQFSDVFSTAETSEGSLGEYAGKAMGVGSSNSLHVNCAYPGVVLELSCVVPRTQWVQGVNPELFHVYYNDFYNPLYDGITLLPTDKLSLFAVDNFMEGTSLLPRVTDSSFGNQSLFAEYKFKSQGILNGDLSLLSTKSTYDSFTMDRTVANYVTQSLNSDGSISFDYTAPSLSFLAAGTMWRYIGRWQWLGNFDRIFVNLRQTYERSDLNPSNIYWSNRDLNVTDDNLVVHNVVDLNIDSKMLPLPDSYLTRDLNDLQNSSGLVSQSE